MKLVLLLLVVFGALAWLAVSRRQRPRGGPPAPRAGQEREGTEPPQSIVSCVHCGVHLPQAEALFDTSGEPYCCEAHRHAGPRQGGRGSHPQGR
jgi:uncharacterized protein